MPAVRENLHSPEIAGNNAPKSFEYGEPMGIAFRRTSVFAETLRNRFYHVDSARTFRKRQRALGLALVKSIIDLQRRAPGAAIFERVNQAGARPSLWFFFFPAKVPRPRGKSRARPGQTVEHHSIFCNNPGIQVA